MRRRNIIGKAVLAIMLGLLAGPRAEAQEHGDLDRYLDKYWAEKRDVRVIQKRLYQKDGRHEFTPFFGFIPNDEFYMYYPVGGRYTYYISEDIGIEAFGSYIFHTHSDLADFLDQQHRLETNLPQRLQWTAGIEGVWSPIHGKLGMFTSKLAHFDWTLMVGVGAMGTVVQTAEEGGKTKGKVDVAGNVGTGLRFFILDWLAFRFEYRNYFFAADGGGLSHPVELTLGVSFFTR